MKYLPLLLLAACLSTPPPAGRNDGGGDDAMIDAGPDGTPDTELPLGVIRKLSTGHSHVCAIDDSGRLFCWGSNRRGQLAADVLLVPRSGTPLQVGLETDWTDVAVGDEHTCGLRGDLLFCWGEDGQGQAGGNGGGAGHFSTPTPPGGAGTGWISVSAGNQTSCGVRDDGGGARRVYCWGNDYDGQLGDGGGNDSGATIRPTAATSEGGTPTDWASVANGTYHTCAIRAGGETYCWGSNNGGELGDGTTTPHAIPTRVVAAVGDGNQLYASISGGNVVTCAIATSGHLYCWGNNGYSQLGIDGIPQTETPMRVGTDDTWTQVSVSYYSACGVRPDGVSCWGSSALGAVGNGAWNFEEVPVSVTGLDGPALVAVGNNFACAAPATGGAHCWGHNPNGELGNGVIASKHVPTQILPDGGWTAVAAGGDHTCGVQAGVVHCWGWNRGFALGAGGDQLTPHVVSGVGAGTATAVGVGRSTTCALVDDAPWCWGYNLSGQVGIGPTDVVVAPMQVGSGAWTDLTVNDQAACAMVGTTRRCWGEGAEYQLGNNAIANVLTPQNADALSWVELSLGFHFGCGIQSGGALACWGQDDVQQQGDGSATNLAMTPHVIASGTMFTRVAAAWDGEHACAISDVGDLFCWGRNNYGQCTDAKPAPEVDTPTIVTGGGDWLEVAAGAQHTCGIKLGGELWCWGAGFDAQLGLGTVSNGTDTPTRVGTDTGWSKVSAGAIHTCAIRDGDLYCWGANVHGQIGDGTSAHPTPQAVLLPS